MKFLVALSPFEISIISSGSEEANQQDHERHILRSLDLFGTLGRRFFLLELVQRQEGLGLIIQEGRQDYWMYHSYAGMGHREWY